MTDAEREDISVECARQGRTHRRTFTISVVVQARFPEPVLCNFVRDITGGHIEFGLERTGQLTRIKDFTVALGCRNRIAAVEAESGNWRKRQAGGCKMTGVAIIAPP